MHTSGGLIDSLKHSKDGWVLEPCNEWLRAVTSSSKIRSHARAVTDLIFIPELTASPRP